MKIRRSKTTQITFEKEGGGEISEAEEALMMEKFRAHLRASLTTFVFDAHDEQGMNIVHFEIK